MQIIGAVQSMDINTWAVGLCLIYLSKGSYEDVTVRLFLIVAGNISRKNNYEFCLGHSEWISGKIKSVGGLCSPGTGYSERW